MIDEKDMALTSIHILTVFITLAMYAVDVTMNSCWLSLGLIFQNEILMFCLLFWGIFKSILRLRILAHFSLHDHDEVERDHASYWTIYERNVLLLKIHAGTVKIEKSRKGVVWRRTSDSLSHVSQWSDS